MPTGIESAGLALAIFPLVLQGIGAYLNGADMAKDIWYWRRKLRCVERELKTESVLFRNTCLRLIDETNFKGVSILMDGDKYTLPVQWKQSDFEYRLSELMGKDIAEIFVGEATLMNDALSELSKRLGFDDVQVENIVDKGKLSSGTSWFHVIKYILKNQDLLTKIKQSNSVIERIALRRAVGSRGSNRKAPLVKIYRSIRKNALNLQAALQEKFEDTTCGCKTTHTASLQLLKIANDSKAKNFDKFVVLFASSSQSPTITPMTWCELEFKPIISDPTAVEDIGSGDASVTEENTTAQPDAAKPQKKRKAVRFSFGGLFGAGRAPQTTETTPATTSGQATEHTSITEQKKIEYLCHAIRDAIVAKTVSDLGVLDSTNPRCSYAISQCKKQKDMSYLVETVTLEKLLQHRILQPRDRLELGVVLASAAMLLHGTIWLKDDWGKEDISFLQYHSRALNTDSRGTIVETANPVLDRPLVRREFKSGSKIVEESSQKQIVLHNSFLYSLGLILVELWFGKLGPEIDSSWPELTIPKIDKHLCQIEQEAGAMYRGAVERCLKGIDHQNRDLNNDDFKTEVELRIVSNLRRHLDAYLSGNDPKEER